MSRLDPARLDIRGLMKPKRQGVKMKTVECEYEKPSFWQLVFSQSKANGAPYGGEQLHGQLWDWPTDTFLQRRLRQVKWLPNDNTSFN
jgi:hypothetical protein